MIKTFRDLREFVPRNWLDADIGIAELEEPDYHRYVEAPKQIYRVSLHQSSNGKRIILLHKTSIKTWEKTKEV